MHNKVAEVRDLLIIINVSWAKEQKSSLGNLRSILSVTERLYHTTWFLDKTEIVRITTASSRTLRWLYKYIESSNALDFNTILTMEMDATHQITYVYTDFLVFS